MKDLKYYLEKAQKEKFAIPQFNFSDYSQLKVIAELSAKLQAPVIIGTSEGESQFFGLEEAVALRDVLRKKLNAPIFLNLDHGKSLEYLKQAADAGYDMIHFDGSKLPLEENIKISKEVVKYGRKKRIIVEGEIGRLGTDASRLYTEKFEIKEENLTKPEEAVRYLKETGVNLLTVSIGNFHGIDASGQDPNLRLDLLKKIQEAVGDNVGLVLHGGSGVPAGDIRQSIQLGIVKININTESRVAYSGALRKFLTENPQEVVPYKFLVSAKEAMAKVVQEKINLFGNVGKA